MNVYVRLKLDQRDSDAHKNAYRFLMYAEFIMHGCCGESIPGDIYVATESLQSFIHKHHPNLWRPELLSEAIKEDIEDEPERVEDWESYTAYLEESRRGMMKERDEADKLKEIIGGVKKLLDHHKVEITDTNLVGEIILNAVGMHLDERMFRCKVCGKPFLPAYGEYLRCQSCLSDSTTAGERATGTQ